MRWAARVTSAALLAFVLFMVYAEGFPGFADLTERETFVSILVIGMMIGLIIGFKYELVGGAIAVICYAIFAYSEGELILGPIFPVFALVGLIYVVLALLKK